MQQQPTPLSRPISLSVAHSNPIATGVKSHPTLATAHYTCLLVLDATYTSFRQYGCAFTVAEKSYIAALFRHKYPLLGKW